MITRFKKIDWGLIGVSILGALAIMSFGMIFVCIFIF